MQKTEFKKEDKAFYTGKPGRFDILTIPPLPFLMLDGTGDPNTSQTYAEAVAALYVLSYQLKFHSKSAHQRDYTVGPLEGLWWADDMDSFTNRQKDDWRWTMMIRQPGWLTAGDIETARDLAIAKQSKRKDRSASDDDLNRLRFETYDEGLCVQVLHLGPYDVEGPVLAELHHNFLPQNDLRPTGRHHEIYLSDPRKIAPEKLKTILRQPVARA